MLDERQEKIGYKIREAQLQKVPYMLVVGDRESGRRHGVGPDAHRRATRAPARSPTSSRRRRTKSRAKQRSDRQAWRSGQAHVQLRDRRQFATIDGLKRSRRPLSLSTEAPRRDDRTRVNERIRVREIRVIDDTGQQLGIMPPPQALAIAKQKGLDLVEISPTAVPPVCRIMDFGKYQYQEQKRAREARKHQKVIEVKEIKFRPKVDEHDYQFKKKHIERFLEDGDKVKATIFFRGREMAHPEIGRRILERLVQELSEVAVAESMPRTRRQPDAHHPEPPAAGRRQVEGGADASTPPRESGTHGRRRPDGSTRNSSRTTRTQWRKCRN